jgi:hypothetical protein
MQRGSGRRAGRRGAMDGVFTGRMAAQGTCGSTYEALISQETSFRCTWLIFRCRTSI